jgi:D-cysteine desulfhydrase family pyridoxal phosphate-dependent enzyme
MSGRLKQRLAELPRAGLISGPTPLERWTRASEALGVELFVKREDTSGIGAGGNKLRKLDLIVGAAMQRGVDWLIPTGGPQSNHARLTAGVAAKLGMGCSLMLRGPWDGNVSGNLLLDHLFGADVTLLGEVDYTAADAAMDEAGVLLRKRGKTPEVMPLGGATAEGTAAFVECFSEIAGELARLGRRADTLIVAGGTASTFAGLRLGAAQLSPQTQIVGVSVSWTKEKLAQEASRLMISAATLLDISHRTEKLWFETDYIGPGYARLSEGALAAVRFAARHEGVLLDTTYTGKAFAGLIDLIDKGRIRKGSTVVFVHTGGVPELFAKAAQLMEA